MIFVFFCNDDGNNFHDDYYYLCCCMFRFSSDQLQLQQHSQSLSQRSDF